MAKDPEGRQTRPAKPVRRPPLGATPAPTTSQVPDLEKLNTVSRVLRAHSYSTWKAVARSRHVRQVKFACYSAFVFSAFHAVKGASTLTKCWKRWTGRGGGRR